MHNLKRDRFTSQICDANGLKKICRCIIEYSREKIIECKEIEDFTNWVERK